MLRAGCSTAPYGVAASSDQLALASAASALPSRARRREPYAALLSPAPLGAGSGTCHALTPSAEDPAATVPSVTVPLLPSGKATDTWTFRASALPRLKTVARYATASPGVTQGGAESATDSRGRRTRPDDQTSATGACSCAGVAAEMAVAVPSTCLSRAPRRAAYWSADSSAPRAAAKGAVNGSTACAVAPAASVPRLLVPVAGDAPYEREERETALAVAVPALVTSRATSNRAPGSTASGCDCLAVSAGLVPPATYATSVPHPGLPGTGP